MPNVLSVAVVGLASPTSVMAAALLELIRRGRNLTGAFPFGGQDDLPPHKSIMISGWDHRQGSLAESLERYDLLCADTVDAVRPRLEAIEPWAAIGDPSFCGGGSSFIRQSTLTVREAVECLRDDLDRLHMRSGRRVVMLDCQSLACPRQDDSLNELSALEAAVERNDERIEDNALYAYAALKSGVPYARIRPGPVPHAAALEELARKEGVHFVPCTEHLPEDPASAAALAIETARCLAPGLQSELQPSAGDPVGSFLTRASELEAQLGGRERHNH
ncbi:MAG: inositol-3-phosphate synthase [Parvularcula sp.]|jgi:myo-inositol-1-phosphate synthase|nr:inositol-3-phosphate synthase [Parvularcula sp.]